MGTRISRTIQKFGEKKLKRIFRRAMPAYQSSALMTRRKFFLQNFF